MLFRSGSAFNVVRSSDTRWRSHKICPSSAPILCLPPRPFAPILTHPLRFFLRLSALSSPSPAAVGRIYEAIPSRACAAGRAVRIAVVISRDGRFPGARILYLNSAPRSPAGFAPSTPHLVFRPRERDGPLREDISGRVDVSSNDGAATHPGRHALSRNTEDRRRARTACLPYPSTCPEFPCKFMHVRRLVFSRSSTRTRAPKCDDYEFRAGIRRRSSVIYEGDNWSGGTRRRGVKAPVGQRRSRVYIRRLLRIIASAHYRGERGCVLFQDPVKDMEDVNLIDDSFCKLNVTEERCNCRNTTKKINSHSLLLSGIFSNN